MKTAVVLSDTHGNMKFINELDGIFKECDYIIHLGDTSSDGAKIRSLYPEKILLVNGNCDLVKLGEDELIIEIENVKIFATHGHLYSVKSTLVKLAKRAEELGCKYALYGHTHRKNEQVLEGVTLLNPGTGSRYADKSYLYLVINGENVTYKTVLKQSD